MRVPGSIGTRLRETLYPMRRRVGRKIQGPKRMPEPAQDMIVRNLIEALERLHEDLDRVELWTAALGSFQTPVPDYEPGDRHLLSASRKANHSAV
jgi:hypothetical protein